MTRLYIEDDDGNVQVVPMESDGITIGRADDNDLVLEERNVSRHHASIRTEGSRFLVADVGARYGLKVNGARILDERTVQPGDVIQIGDYKVKVLARDGAVADAPGSLERRETVKEQPAIRETPASEKPTRMNPVQEMEEVAASDWASDFDDEEELYPGGVQGRGKTLVVITLLLVALVLGLFYYWASSETEIASDVGERTSVTAVAVQSVEPALEPVAAPEPPGDEEPPPTAMEPAEVPAVPDPVQPEPAKVVEPPAPEPAAKPVVKTSPKPSPKPSTSRRKKVASRDGKPPRATPSKTAKTSPPKEDGLMAKIDAALGERRAADAQKLLDNCRGSGCFKRWKKLATMYDGIGNPKEAIVIYKRLIRLTRDPRGQEWFKKRITALSESVD